MIKLKEFLQKYSTIPNTFIEDFFCLFENSVSDQRFKIDLEVVAKWLNSKKGSIKKTLSVSYKENIDFVIYEIPSSTNGGRPNEKILLTEDCFKRVCLLSRTGRGEEVRNYYLQLEELVEKYKNYIIQGLEKRIEELENNQRPLVDT